MKLFTQIENKNPIEYIYSWKAPERYWKPKDRSWYVVYAFFFTVLVALLALLNEWVLILAVIAFAFLWFVQGSTEPEIVEHVVSSVGIKTYEKLYKWNNIKDFWFSKKKEGIILNFDIIDEAKPEADFKKRLTLVIDSKDEKKLFELLFTYIEYGTTDDVGLNLFTSVIYGTYIPVEEFMDKPLEEELDQMLEDEKNKVLEDEASEKIDN